MICKNCNKKIKDGSLFCSHCGMLPYTTSYERNDNTVRKENPFKNEKLHNYIFYALQFLSVAVIILWFCKTVSLQAGSNSGLYNVSLPLFLLLKGAALVAVVLAVISLAVRIFVLVKKDSRSVLLYSVSGFSDILSLGCIIYKLFDVRTAVADGVYESLTSAQFSLNVAGWLFVAVCIISLLLHLILVLNRVERKN